MTYPDPNPEVTAHENGLKTLLDVITYVRPLQGGGGVHGVRLPREAINFGGYSSPAIVMAFTGSTLGSQKSDTIGGCVFEEEFHFELYAINSSFDTEGEGRIEGQTPGDPGSYPLITDIRLATYGKSFGVVPPWPGSGPGPTMVKVFPANPPVVRWDLRPKDDPNLVIYRLNVRTTWLINAG
jgi:hypothetical protein